jgi:hypothetical protein
MPNTKKNEKGIDVGFEQGKHESLGAGGGSVSKNFPQTPAEISQVNKVRALTKAYRQKRTDESTKAIQDLIGRGMENLAYASVVGKLNLLDTERLKEQSMVYLNTCMEDGVLPDFQSFCLSLGYSRSGVLNYIKRATEDDPSREWLIMMRDTFSSMLSQAALGGDVNTIFAIFQQKAMYGWQETSRVEVVNESILGTPKTPEEIQRMNERYMMDAVYEEVD